MVTQFQGHEFEKEFYTYDKVMAESDLKKIYLIPDWNRNWILLNLQYKNPEPGIRQEVAKQLMLVQNEINARIGRNWPDSSMVLIA